MNLHYVPTTAVTRSFSQLARAAPAVPVNVTPSPVGVNPIATAPAPTTVIIAEPVADNDLDDLPELLSASSSSSDSSFERGCPVVRSTCATMTAISNVAEYQQSAPTKPPTLSAGEVTPEQLQKWELGCRQYFFHKDVEADNQVKRVAWGLLDPRIQQWYAIEAERLNGLDFGDFMVELRSYWLPSDWASDLRLKMLSSRQGTRPFLEWVVDVQTQNSLLVGDEAHLSEAGLRYHLEANMNKDLAVEYRSSDAKNAATLRLWIEKVKKLDEKRMRDARQLREQIEASMRNNPKSRPTDDKRKVNDPARRWPPHQPASAPRLPLLTDEERKLLRENEGCFKCRLPFQTHQTYNCPNGFPDVATYKTITAETVRRLAKKPAPATKAKASVAAVDCEELVAVVMPSAALGDGSDSDEECVFPFSRPQFLWKCHVNGPLVDLPLEVDALIDNGSSLVLIDEGVVTRLGLRTRELHKPVSIGTAFSSSSLPQKATVSRYVNLSLSSIDARFHSRTVRAIVAPSLCKPIILGVPFLERNNIIIDHGSRSCIASESNYNLLQPAPLTTPPVTPSTEDVSRLKNALRLELHKVLPLRKVLVECDSDPVAQIDLAAAVQVRVEQLATLEDLVKRDHAVKEEYKDRFPSDIPHCDTLPDDILFRVRPKDASKIIQLRSYDCPKKYKDAWHTLLQQHIAAG